MKGITTLIIMLWMLSIFAAYYSLKTAEIICFEITMSCLG